MAGEAIAFYTLAALILGFGVGVITSRSSVHSILFLVLDFLCVAALYVTLGAEFIAVIQVLVYAGGIDVVYLFGDMLVNLKRPPELHEDPRRQTTLGLVLAGAVLGELMAIAAYSAIGPPSAGAAEMPVVGNTQRVGWLLYTDYLVPFEVASILLLVAMIGAIVLAKREL